MGILPAALCILRNAIKIDAAAGGPYFRCVRQDAEHSGQDARPPQKKNSENHFSTYFVFNSPTIFRVISSMPAWKVSTFSFVTATQPESMNW